MPSISFAVKAGKIVGREWLWKSVKRFFQATLDDGRYVWPMPEKEKKTRSVQQNRYYHGVVCKLISGHTGYTGDEVHQIMAEQFLSYEKNGKQFVKSTTKLKTAEFEEYLEACRRFAAIEMQVYIPLPNEPSTFYYSLQGGKK